MKKLLIASLIALACGLWWWLRPDAASSSNVQLTLQQAARSAIAESINATGVIKAETGAEVKVGSRVSGVLERIHVDIGDRVEAGDLLAELDDSDILPELESLRARVRELRELYSYSRLLWERNARIDILAEAELAALQRDVEVNAARLEQAQAELERLQVRHSWSRVRAPIGGTIASVSTQQGETIAASFAAPTFVTIVDLERLEIQAYVDEADIGKVEPGMPVGFGVDTYPGEEFRGTVVTVRPKAEIVNNVVNYIVIIDIDPHPGFLLRPEMTAHVRFLIARNDTALVVPRSALLSEGGSYFMVLADANGATSGTAGTSRQWRKVPVITGIVDSSGVEITSGLNEGDRYVVNARDWLNAQRALDKSG